MPEGPLASDAVLALEAFGVAFGERVVLADVTMQVPSRGTCVLMGPAGGGKSTLLRSLAGLNRAQPDLRQWGSVSYVGGALTVDRHPVLVQQDARYFTSTVRENLVSAFADRQQLDRAAQADRLDRLFTASGCAELRDRLDEEALGLPTALRRLLSVLRAAASDAPLICLDESTAGLDDAAAERILATIRWYAIDHAVLFVTHHQGQARDVADRVVLLAGGRVQEDTTGYGFFAAIPSPIVERFLDSGGVSIPSPGADPSSLSEDVPLPPPLPEVAINGPAAFVGPRDFRWLLPGRLGGLPRPGIVASLAEDLAGLGRLGVTTLVTLEETETVPVDELRSVGIAALHFPIVDMEAPEAPIAADWCRTVAELLDVGAVVAMHCRAGQGRTGTMLACQLIWFGATAIEALDAARDINPRWVTSTSQVRFLSTFHAFVHGPS